MEFVGNYKKYITPDSSLKYRILLHTLATLFVNFLHYKKSIKTATVKTETWREREHSCCSTLIIPLLMGRNIIGSLSVTLHNSPSLAQHHKHQNTHTFHASVCGGSEWLLGLEESQLLGLSKAWESDSPPPSPACSLFSFIPFTHVCMKPEALILIIFGR